MTYREVDRRTVPSELESQARRGIADALRYAGLDGIVRPELRFYRAESAAASRFYDAQRPIGTREGYGPGRFPSSCFGPVRGTVQGFTRSVYTGDRPTVWVNADAPFDSARFVAAHEVGHCLDHRAGREATEDAANDFADRVTGMTPSWVRRSPKPARQLPVRQSAVEQAEAVAAQAVRRHLTPEQAAALASVQQYHASLMSHDTAIRSASPPTREDLDAWVANEVAKAREYQAATAEYRRLKRAGYVIPPIRATVQTRASGVCYVGGGGTAAIRSAIAQARPA